MKYPVTAVGILQALKKMDGFSSEREVAEAANMETTSENLQQIIDEMYDFARLGVVELSIEENTRRVKFRWAVEK